MSLPAAEGASRKNVDADAAREALLDQRGLTSPRAPSLAHRAIERLDDEGSAMTSQPGSTRPRRAPRLRRVGGRPQRTPAQRARQAAYDRLIALVETPEGTVHLLEEYARVAPADVAQILRDWQAWLRRKDQALADRLAARGVANA